MSKITFDLNKELFFNSFEVLTYERNKNSPSANTLRGKGSMFYAENFSYVDKFNIKIKIKKNKKNSEYTDMEKLKIIYSKYRIKGLVFIDNEEIFNKIHSSLIYNKNEAFIKTAIKQLSNKENILEYSEFKKLEEETKLMLLKLDMLETFEEALKIFPKITKIEYEQLKEEYKEKYQLKNIPFLTCLHKINISTIPDSSDGFEIELTIGIVKDLIDMDSTFIDSYKDKEKEFSIFYNEIENKIKSYNNIKNNLNLNFVDYSKTRMFLNEKQADLNDTLNKTFLNEHDININSEDISQFQLISYNNISEIPIQGKSTTLKQILGVSESNLTIKILFKNDKDYNFQKLKSINSLINKDQRQLKGKINFPFVNSFDFKSVELSDFFYSNDSESDAVFATMILKLNSYNNHGVEINSFGETVDETFSATSKNRTANIPIIYSSFYKLNKILSHEDLNKVKEIIIDVKEKETFTYKNLMECYFNKSSILDLYKKTTEERYLKLSDNEKLNEFINSYSNMVSNVNASNPKALDIVGVLPLIDFLNKYIYIGFETKAFDKTIVNNFSNYKETFNFINNDLYNESLYFIVQSMFPSLVNNLEEDNYYFNETIKVSILDFLTSLPEIICNTIIDLKINETPLIEVFNLNKYFNEKQSKSIVEQIIKIVFNLFLKRLDNQDLINKIITGFNLNKIQNEKSFNENVQPITIEDITKNVYNSLSRIKLELNNYLNENNNTKFIDVITNQILSIIEIRSMAYSTLYNDFYDDNTNQNLTDKEHYKNFVSNSHNVFSKIDLITVPFISILCNSFGISNTFFGFINNIAAEKIIDIGIKSSMLATNTANKNFTNDLIESLFGKDFTNNNNALSFYNSLTSNIALTDLGSYLDIYCKDNSGEYKAVFNILIKSLTSDNYYSKAIKEYNEMLKNESNAFYEDSDTIDEALKNVYTQLKESENKEKKEEEINKIVNDYNESISGHEKLNNLYNAQFNNKLTYSKDFNSKDLRIKRIKALTQSIDYLNNINETFNSNLLYSLPTYDIYIFQKSNFYNSTSRIGVQKIENYLGIDKVMNINITFNEDTRNKIAVIKTLDTSESIKPYNFKLKSNINSGLLSIDEEIKNSKETDYYSKTKQELRIGDQISIYMGYCNENQLVFNGVINKIIEGKVKTIECINYSYQLQNNVFDMEMSEGSCIVDPKNTLKRILRNTYKDNLVSLNKAKTNSLNINDEFIPSNFDKSNFNLLNQDNEKCSNYNILFHAMSYTVPKMRNFNNNSQINMVDLKINSEEWYDINFYQSWWKSNKETLSNDFVTNINNVDRDIKYYGYELRENVKSNYSNQSNSYGGTEQRTLELIPPKSSYIIDSENTQTRFEIEDSSFKDVLCELEKRSPGSYWDVLDSGYGATLFFGRPYYNLYLKKQKSDYEFSKTESHYFDNLIEDNKSNLLKLNKLNLFLFFKNAIASIEGNDKNINDDKSISGEFIDNKDYEPAQNLIFAVSNKNLISCKLEINANVHNKIVMKHDTTLLEKLGNVLKGNTPFSTHIFSFGSLIDLEGNEEYSERIKEMIVKDENIRTTHQSVESGISRLQMELENYYSGSIIILFNPKIRYRSEVVIFDSVNNIYGSVIVKHFEHKFDHRGAYTIITPMMKIESLDISKDTYITSFWTRLFYSRDSELTKANKLTTSFNSILDKLNSEIDKNFINKIVSLKSKSTPVIMNNVSFDIQNKKSSSIKTSGLQPLVFYPLLKRNEFLLPDSDIYSLQQIKHYKKLTNWLNRLKNGTINLFKFQEEYENTMEQNIFQKIGNYFVKRFSSLTEPKMEEIKRLNFDTILGLPNKDTISEYRFEQMKKVLLKDLYNTNFIDEDIPMNMFKNKNSFAFFNTKILHENSEELKYDNIVKVISNFDFVNLVEISDFDEKQNAVGGLNSVNKIGQKIINKLNDLKDDNSFEWHFDVPIMIRESAMTHDKTSANEYHICVRKKFNSNENPNNFLVQIDKTLNININFKPLDSTEFLNVIVNIPTYNIAVNNKSFKLFVFHNIYFANKITSKTDNGYFRIQAMKKLFELLNNQNKLGHNIVCLGDYNISMYKWSNNSNEVYSPVLGEVLMLNPNGLDDLSVKGDNFIPMIKPHTLTTLGTKANKNSFDNILINNNFEKNYINKNNNFKYGVFYEAKYKTNKESVDSLSDHFPIYFKLK